MSKMWKKMKKDAEALSPVVATLMLVIVTVAAVAAIAVWYNGWQKSETQNLGQVPPIQLNLVGSTTVTDFMTVAAPAFMNNNTGYHVSVSGIGSGAGLTAIENNRCDIGMISDDLNAVTAGTTNTYPNLKVFTVAYDGVAVFMGANTANYYGFNATPYMTPAVIEGIYHVYSLANTSFPMTLGNPNHEQINSWGDLELACGEPLQHGADLIMVHYRSDSSGTQDAFCDKALMSHKFLGSTGNAALTNSKGENGNPAMVTDVIADGKGIGFATAAMVTASGSGATAFSFGIDMQKHNQISAAAKYVMDGVLGMSTGYTVWHPLNLVTNGAPGADAQIFINYVMNPTNNIQFCAASGFTSIFQSP
ncbi:MAG: substrate-binding domain-containing protein [Methanomassiliicoccales archaeon]|jgi:ABC-type phosphate transport system substrate-binding protein